MIFTERTITVRKGESTINEPVILYRGDYDVEVRFTIKNSKFIFLSQTNLIESEKAAYAQLAIIKPDGDNVFSDIAKCEEGTVAFVLTSDMIDELHDVGLYSFQIRLYDQDKQSRASIPPVEYGIEIREPIASEDHINSVDEALVGYSIAKTTSLDNEPVGPTFDDEGNYNVTDWETGDRITEGKLNKIEDALNTLNQNEQTLDKKIINNYNVLNSQIQTVANKGTTVDVIQQATKEEIDRQVADGTISRLLVEDSSITIKKLADDTKELLNPIGLPVPKWIIGQRDNGGKIMNDQCCILMDKMYFNVGDTIENFQTVNNGYKIWYYGLDGEVYDASKSVTSWRRTSWTCEAEGYYTIHVAYMPTSTTTITEDNKQALLDMYVISSSAIGDIDGNALVDKSVSKDKISDDVFSGLLTVNNIFGQGRVTGFGFMYGVIPNADNKGMSIKDNFICLSDSYALTRNVTPSTKVIYGRQYPTTQTASYLSDICIVDDEIWAFATGSDDKSDYSTVWRFKYDPINNVFKEDPKFFWVDWGHVNAINYNPITDSLILGNGSADYNLSNKIYIISNVKAIKESDNGAVFKLSDCGVEIDCSDRPEFGKKLNVVWNNMRPVYYNYSMNSEYLPNLALAYSDDVNKIHMLVMGYGNYKYKYGTYKAPTANCIWNGTYNILCTQQIGDVNETIGNPGSYEHCGQGADSLDGRFYIGLGHSACWYTELSFESNTSYSRRDFWHPHINHATGETLTGTTRSFAITRDYTIIALDTNIYFIPR